MIDVLLNEELWRIVSGKDKGLSRGTESNHISKKKLLTTSLAP